MENNILLYHGSCHAGITELKPFISNHGKAMVYLTTDIVVATIYTVRPVDRFLAEQGLPVPQGCYQFYPYGFDKDTGTVVLDEYYPHAFEETYCNCRGYVYLCENNQNYNNPTNIKCALSTEESVKVIDVIEIADVGTQLLAYKEQGKLLINFYDTMPHARRERLERMMQQEINNTTDDHNGALTFFKAKFSHLL